MMLSSLFAQVTNEPEAWNWPLFGWHVFLVAIYVIIGLAFFAAAYLVIDKVTPFSLGKELLEKQNVAVAIVLASVFIGIALILAAVMRG
jgi:putative membrane protein